MYEGYEFDDDSEEKQAIREFLTVPDFEWGEHEMSDGLYTLGERGMFPDNVDSVSTEQAKMIVQLYLAIQNRGTFPEELKM